ncbi:serine protease [Actinomadura syzygii]|uniref:Trypsin-like peptidase domain-containing protein n=1 Tax=Actinomadura syzygii TaxID=1427538 RepID=A0A5D0UIU5_9ACTN|nr:serine protease [Actinomadura syzygii]TYC17562.1 trypsin-like peptidase domain-containing protein [Actinomadura syzygii]
MAGEYWVEIRQDDRPLGGGFILARRYVLTALHCLDKMTPGDDDVTVWVEGNGPPISGRVLERATDADLAIIEILDPVRMPLMVPAADHSAPDDVWRGPYRPTVTDPYLDGVIAREAMKYACEGGAVIEALQLTCNQSIGDYSGYSGGPVERVCDERGSAVVGVLLEQHHERYRPRDVRHGEERASGTLFAAAISEATRRFSCLDVGNLIDVLRPRDAEETDPPPRAARKPSAGSGSHSELEALLAEKELKLRALTQWEKEGLLNAATVDVLKLRIAEDLITGGVTELSRD